MTQRTVLQENVLLLKVMFYTYILQNTLTGRYYTGSTSDLEERLLQHNAGQTKSTKHGAPNWKIVYQETFQTRSEAIKREYQIKRKKSRKYIELLIQQGSD